MKKIILTIAAIFFIALAVISVGKDLIIRVSAENIVKSATGLRLEIQDLKTSLVGSFLRIKGLRVFNPDKFQDRSMLNMPEIYVHYDLPAIIGGKIHLSEVRIDLEEFQVVKNKDGSLNLDSLKAIQNQKKEASTGEKTKPAPIQIDVLQLKIGKVIYKDYSSGGSPSVNEFNVNLNEKFTNVTDLNSLTSLIVVKALTNTRLGQLLNIDLGGLQSSVSGTLSTAQNVALQSAQVLSHTMQQVVSADTVGKASGAVESVAGDIGKAAGKLTGAFKLPFGESSEKK